MGKITRNVNSDGSVTLYLNGKKAWRGAAAEAEIQAKNLANGAGVSTPNSLTEVPPPSPTRPPQLGNRKIVDLDKGALIMLRVRINDALKALGEELGLELHARNGHYFGAGGDFKLEIKVTDADVQETRARELFNAYCWRYGLEPQDFNCEFSAGRKRYKLLGFEPKRSKFPLRCHDLTEDKVILLTDMVVPAIVAARS